MDKSVISTFKENIELAASKYDTISVHLNALRQRVLGSRSIIDASKPATAVLSSNELEVGESESFEGLASNENLKLDPKSIASDNELGFCDANSSLSEETSDHDAGSDSKEEETLFEHIMKADPIQEHDSEEKLSSELNEDPGIKENRCKEHDFEEKLSCDLTKTIGAPGFKEIESEIADNLVSEEEEEEDNLMSSSSPTDSSFSDEEKEDIYSELLKRIEHEEKRSINYNLHSQKDREENELESHESDSHSLGSISYGESNKNELKENKKKVPSVCGNSFSKRTQKFMESIEEDNEEWEMLRKQFTNQEIEEISFEKIFPNKQKNYDNITDECISKDLKVKRNEIEENDNLSIKTKQTTSKVSVITSKKSNSNHTLSSRTISQDHFNSRFDKTLKAETVEPIKGKKVPSKPLGPPGLEKQVKKKNQNISKRDPKKEVKTEKFIKSKQVNIVHRIAGTKLHKNSKSKNNITKTFSKKISQKNVQTKTSKSKLNHSLTENFKCNTKKQEFTQSFENNLKPILSSEQVKKHIEPLIKSKPDNIFLKKELNRISEGTFIKERGSGDGQDKVRSQAIINSMNQSCNNLNKGNVASHFVKSNKMSEISPSIFLTTNNSKPLNKTSNPKTSLPKINAMKNQPPQVQPTSKKPSQNVLNKIDYSQSEQMIPHIFKTDESKRTTSRRERTATDPKEILAQLEKEISFSKLKHSEYNEDTIKMEPYLKTGQTLPASNRHSKIITPNDVKSELKLHKSELNRGSNNNKQKNEMISKSFPLETLVKFNNHNGPREDKETKRKSNPIKHFNKIKNSNSKIETYLPKDKEIVRHDTFPSDTISSIPNKMLTLNFDGTKPKIVNFPFILGQSTSKSYNIQANVQQTMSVMMMLPSESVRRTLSVDTKMSSEASNQTALSIHSHKVKCPACFIKNDKDESFSNLVEDPWDTEYTSKSFVRCTCIPRNTVSFKTVMKQLLSESSVASLLPISETSTLYEESIDRNNENKQLCRRSDLSHLTKLLHATQRIRERLVT